MAISSSFDRPTVLEMLPPSKYPRQRLLVVLTLATGFPAALVQGLFVFIGNDSWGRGLIAAGALMLPPAFIAWGLLAGATRHRLGLVLAYAGLFTLAGGALFGTLAWYGMAILAGSLGGRPALLLFELAVVAPYVVLGVAASRTARELYGRAVVSETGPQLLSVVLLYVMAFAVGSRFDSGISSRERHSKWATRDALRRSVFRVQACAIRHGLAHPDSGYPRSLAAMGPAGQACLDKRLAKGEPQGLIVVYEPAAPNAVGRTPSFVVRARAKRKRPASGDFQSAIGDTSGFVGETHGTESMPPTGRLDDGMIDEIAHLRTCALLARAEHPEGSAAASLTDMAARLGRFHRGDLRAYLCRPGTVAHHARLEAHDSLGTDVGYRVSYTGIRDNSGRLRDFEIVARPIAYGESGIRSYFARSDGPIHVTLEDRAATPSDPVVPACEYGEKLNTLPRYGGRAACARMPSIQPPSVALAHDSVATAGRPFIISLRDPADRTRPADSTYEHHLSCGMTPGSWEPPPSSITEIFRLGSKLNCTLGIDPRVAYFHDTMHVVLYTRDRSGAIAKAHRVVRLVVRR